ncbi:TolC family protein [Fusibacter paucivorans]|uniref:TolC family protein n=1 Tax=Fusibacter paucivorans TaxID=76009 RepID=A0ABS5PNX8_9FIRM|nr:TolC family protein [Fusibacter paucivorans]MBS7526597.1 TolC family protein [Fusibacter paucivorans]
MKKYLITTLMIGMLYSSFAFADTTIIDPLLTLDEVYNLAIENSIDIKTADDNIEIAEDELQDAKGAKEDIEWSYKDADEYMTLVFADKYDIPLAENALAAAKRDKENALKDLKIDVTSRYIDYLQTVDNLETSQADLEQAQTTYNNKTKEHELGLITSSDLEAFNVSLLQAELNVQMNENALEQAQISFNQMIGYPIDTLFRLTTVMDVKTTVDYNITTLTKNIEIFDQTLLDLKEDLAEKELKLELIEDNVLDTKSVSFKGSTTYIYGKSSEYSTTKDDIEDLQDDYDEALKSEIINLRIAFNSLKNTELSVNINKLNYDSAVRQFNTATVKSDLGLVTAYELQDAKNNVTNMYNIYMTSINDLYTQDLEFQKTIGTYEVTE